VEFSKAISRTKAKNALTMLQNLEEIDSIERITALLVA
jgi:hypothetical protein